MSACARRVVDVLLAGAAMAFGAPAFAQDNADAFVRAHRCPVVEQLRILHASMAPKDRYLILSLKNEAQSYVQCLFLPDKLTVLCEASSGYHRASPPVWQLAPQRVTELERLGFSPDRSAGNYQRMFDIGADLNFERIAELMLSALYRGYGANANTPILWKAPLVPKRNDIKQRCASAQ